VLAADAISYIGNVVVVGGAVVVIWQLARTDVAAGSRPRAERGGMCESVIKRVPFGVLIGASLL
jgi:hypothetical protein